MGSLLMDLKLDRAFGQLDVNANGYVDHDDVEALAGRLLEAFKESPTSPRGTALTAAFEQWWQALLADVDPDEDGRITAQEWNKGMVDVLVDSEQGFDKHFRPLAQAAFELADGDGDGQLSQEEFEVWQKAFRTPKAQARHAFEHLDSDGDGQLNVEELIEAARQYYTGKGNPAGDWLYGRIG